MKLMAIAATVPLLIGWWAVINNILNHSFIVEWDVLVAIDGQICGELVSADYSDR